MDDDRDLRLLVHGASGRMGAALLRRGEERPGIRVVDGAFVRAAHARWMQVHVWTVNERNRMRELLDLGVDGIVTDHIETLRDVLTERGAWMPGPGPR